MKIVVAGTRGFPHIQGGVETHCEQLYPRLVERGCEVTVIRRSCYVSDQLDEYQGVQLKNVFAPRKKMFEAIVHTFLAVIEAKKMKADVLHIHAIGPALMVPFARMLGLKVVLTHHGPDYERQKWGRGARWFLRLGERFGVQCSNELIVISEVINEIVRKKYKRNNAHLIFNGVETPVHSENVQYIESLGLRKGNYILSVGRFVPEKGFDLLVEAYSRLENGEIRLVLAGDADHETDYSVRLKKTAEANGVALTGFITGEKLNEIFSHARLFVLPSSHEGLPIVLLEAMSHRLDVLVSDIPANKAVALPESSYFKSGDSQDLSEKLRKKLEKQGTVVQYDMSSYNWDVIASQVLEVYRKTRKVIDHK